MKIASGIIYRKYTRYLINTSVHIPKELSDRLNRYLKHHKIPKNKFIVEAIKKTLDEQEDRTSWHPDLLNWQGVPEFEAGV
ncbi:MAG: hypothetical protein AAGF83_08565 [Cyanobacteria bacterium P01_G01_bin.67]